MPKRPGLRDDDLLGRLADLERRADRHDEAIDGQQDRLLKLEEKSPGKPPKKD